MSESRESQSVELKLQGQKTVLKTSGDPLVIREVVELATRKLQQAESRSAKAAAPHHVALLALLELAEEYVQAKQRFSAHQQKLESKSEELFRLLDSETK